MNREGWGRNRDIPHAKFIPVRYGDLNNEPCVMYEVLFVILKYLQDFIWHIVVANKPTTMLMWLFFYIYAF